MAGVSMHVLEFLSIATDSEHFEWHAARPHSGILGASTAHACPDEAMHAAEQQHFHVAVVDRSLLGRDSGQLISRLKAAHGHLQVIVLSGHGDALSVAGSRPRCL